MQLYIRHLPKDRLLYELWKCAKYSNRLDLCKHLRPILDLETAKTDINHMINNKRNIDLKTYYGRLLYVDITLDYFDDVDYNLRNGKGLAAQVVRQLKKQELERTILSFYKFN